MQPRAHWQEPGKTAYMGCIGEDDFGKKLIDACKKALVLRDLGASGFGFCVYEGLGLPLWSLIVGI